jgi:hypothetical protein
MAEHINPKLAEIRRLREMEAWERAGSTEGRLLASLIARTYPGKNIVVDYGIPDGSTVVMPLPGMGRPILRGGAPSARLMASNEYRQLQLSPMCAKYALEREGKLKRSADALILPT